MHRPAEVGGGDAEERARLLVGEHELADAVDHDLGDRPGVERALAEVEQVADLGLPAVAIGRAEQPVAEGRAGDLAEHPALRAHRREHVGAGDQHLRLAQEEVAALVQREVEVAEDPRLGLGVEVHERVPADQQLDARDRRVLHEVVAPEDHRSPQVRAEGHACRRALEVAFDELRGHRLDAALGVACRGARRPAPPRRRRWRRSSPARSTPPRPAPRRARWPPCRPPRPRRSPRTRPGSARSRARPRAGRAAPPRTGSPTRPCRGRTR